MYANVYVLDVPVHSISGTHSITEEDLGLAPGTLPPEDLATLGNLIVVDRKLLAPGEKLRAKKNRYLASVGVKTGVGTVVTDADLQSTLNRLEEIRKDFYDWKSDFLSRLPAELDKRVAEHPEYAELIRRYSPDLNRIQRRLSFEIDVYKIDVPVTDPNRSVLAKTLNRDANDISKRLIKEIADFVENAHKVSIQKSQKLCKQNMGPLRDTLLPKIKSFQLLDSSLRAVSEHLEAFIKDVVVAIDMQPSGSAAIEGSDLKKFEARMNQLRSVSAIEALIANAPRSNDLATPAPKPAPVPASKESTPKRSGQLPKRPHASPVQQDSMARRPVTF